MASRDQHVVPLDGRPRDGVVPRHADFTVMYLTAAVFSTLCWAVATTFDSVGPTRMIGALGGGHGGGRALHAVLSASRNPVHVHFPDRNVAAPGHLSGLRPAPVSPAVEGRLDELLRALLGAPRSAISSRSPTFGAVEAGNLLPPEAQASDRLLGVARTSPTPRPSMGPHLVAQHRGLHSTRRRR